LAMAATGASAKTATRTNMAMDFMTNSSVA
jgi:hypothetical protein